MGTKIYKIIKLVFGRYLIITFTAVWIVAGLIFNVFDVMGEKQKMGVRTKTWTRKHHREEE